MWEKNPLMWLIILRMVMVILGMMIFFMIFVDRVDLGKCQTVTTAHQLPAWREGLQNLTAPVQSRRTE